MKTEAEMEGAAAGQTLLAASRSWKRQGKIPPEFPRELSLQTP